MIPGDGATLGAIPRDGGVNFAVALDNPAYYRLVEGKESRYYDTTGTGNSMNTEEWADPRAHTVAVYLDGSDDPDEAPDGTPMVDDDFLVLVNAWWEPITFTVPEARPDQEWRTEIDSFDPSVPAEGERPRHAGDRVRVRPRSLTVLRSPR